MTIEETKIAQGQSAKYQYIAAFVGSQKGDVVKVVNLYLRVLHFQWAFWLPLLGFSKVKKINE